MGGSQARPSWRNALAETLLNRGREVQPRTKSDRAREKGKRGEIIRWGRAPAKQVSPFGRKKKKDREYLFFATSSDKGKGLPRGGETSVVSGICQIRRSIR